jgi:hypothetical protein
VGSDLAGSCSRYGPRPLGRTAVLTRR